MIWAEIPEAVRLQLASPSVRMYHALWHLVRNQRRWNNLDPTPREELIQQGWLAPRFEGEPGAGVDFLYMHRRMIAMVNGWAAEVAVPVDEREGHNPVSDHQPHPREQNDFVRPWITIPWDHADPVWPMPIVDLNSNPDFSLIFGRAKEQLATDFYRQRVADAFDNSAWLRTQTVDQLGTSLESTIHGWMHLHWSTEPPSNPNTLDPTNDWLGSPFSSHVNRHFWKLHGWIDERIHAWEDAHGQATDLTGGWDGPPDSFTGEHHRADPMFFSMLGMAEQAPLLMPWNDLLLETAGKPVF